MVKLVGCAKDSWRSSVKVGDLVKYAYGTEHILLGVVMCLDLEGEAVQCFMRGEKLWFNSHQLEVVNAGR